MAGREASRPLQILLTDLSCVICENLSLSDDLSFYYFFLTYDLYTSLMLCFNLKVHPKI